MKAARTASLLRTSAICLVALSIQVHAAPGDDSFDPNPDIFDLDKAAQFDLVNLIGHVIGNSIGMQQMAEQKFETGFLPQQLVNDWFSIGSNRMRIGFGSSLDGISWSSRIGTIDATASEYGLHHPHGTYGNAPGVTSPSRNYVSDLQFLTYDPASQASPPTYVVMQFETPISFLYFGMHDYAAGTGGSADISIWQGANLGNLMPLQNTGGTTRNLPADTVAGDFEYFIGAPPISGPPNQRTSFSFAILELGIQDATIGFDNIRIATPVPEPETYAMFLAGLCLLGVAAHKRRI